MSMIIIGKTFLKHMEDYSVNVIDFVLVNIILMIIDYRCSCHALFIYIYNYSDLGSLIVITANNMNLT